MILRYIKIPTSNFPCTDLNIVLDENNVPYLEKYKNIDTSKYQIYQFEYDNR